MADYLAREDAPLSEEQWEQLDEVVVGVAKKLLVGRRVLPVYGPLGAGPAGVPMPKLQVGEGPVRVARTALVELHETAEDFVVDWREFERAAKLGIAMDWSVAAAAAAACADREDQMVFAGCEECGLAGLLTVEGAQQVKGGDWAQAEALYGDVVTATTQLVAAGHPGPFALVMSPGTRALTHRFIQHGLKLRQMIEEQATAGIFTSRHVPDKTILALCVGTQVADLAVGVDLTVAYLGNEGMTHLFRVFETIAPRVKQPSGLCVVKAGQ